MRIPFVKLWLVCEAFEVKSIVTQGRILSPWFFVLVIVCVMRRVAEEINAGIVWREWCELAHLLYMDDNVLTSKGTEEMQRVLDCLVRDGRRFGLVINCPKTEKINMNIDKPRYCIIAMWTVKKVEMFKNLGMVLSWDEMLNVEFDKRLRKANQVMSTVC